MYAIWQQVTNRLGNFEARQLHSTERFGSREDAERYILEYLKLFDHCNEEQGFWWAWNDNEQTKIYHYFIEPS